MLSKEMVFNIFCCPVCLGNLIWCDTGYKCIQCKKQYPVLDDIPDFYIPVQNKLADEISSVNIEYYDSTANSYESDYRKINKFFRKIFRSFIVKDIFDIRSYKRIGEVINRYLKDDGIFLDLGCGTGNILRNNSLKEKNGIGIDISSAMLKKSVKHNCNIARANNYKTPFKNNSIDMICASSVVHHMANLNLFFKEISRILKSGGIFFTDFDPNPIALSIKNRNSLYKCLSKMLKKVFKKGSQLIDKRTKIDRGKVDYHYAGDNCSPQYNVENIRKVIKQFFVNEPKFYFHINSSSIFNLTASNASIFNRLRRRVLYYMSKDRTLSECGEYMLMIVLKA